MIRFFEKEDKTEIMKLAADFLGEKYDSEEFGIMFDEIVDGSPDERGISVLHAGEFLGYCCAHIQDEEVIVHQLYIKPQFQKLKVAPQVFDFIEAEFPDKKYRAIVPQDNEVANKVFAKRGYEIIAL